MNERRHGSIAAAPTEPQPVLEAAAVATPGLLFQLQTLGGTQLPDDPVFAVAPSAYEARALLAQIFRVEPTSVRLRPCPEGFRPPRDALIYRLEPGQGPLGERWILYRGLRQSQYSIPSMNDREQILRRRAVFLSSALAVLAGCERQGGTAPPPVTALMPEAFAGGTPLTPSPEGPGLPPPEEPPPSLEPPLEVGKYRKIGVDLAELLREMRREIEEIEQSFPRECQDGCQSTLKPLADKLRAFTSNLRDLSPLCPPSSPEGRALDKWQKEHLRYLQRRLVRIEEAAKALAQRYEGQAGEATWTALRREEMRPMVCLSCARW
ncbi:MAG: hypothetical protein RMJ98_02130 [Myxococcales bacterium]|nr:hypothetical protein [Polyangiaceae bacterium]MDW8248087.1 hypothetical protein [Myxococcales bacterium]